MPTPETLRAAFDSYVSTTPSRDRLKTHIETHGLELEAEEITRALDALLETASSHLYDYPGGVPWTKEFITAYENLLTAKHPWIDAAVLTTLNVHAQWLCWHDGLNAE